RQLRTCSLPRRNGATRMPHRVGPWLCGVFMVDNGPFHRFVALSTDIFVLLREMFIVALFGLLLFAPSVFKTLLTRVGISTLTTPIGNIDVAQVKDAGNTVSS